MHQCVHCKPYKVSAGEKANIENHVLKMHVPSFNIPYACRLCSYRCTRLREFTWHVDHFKEHLLKRQQSRDTFDQTKYMVVAAQPYVIQEGRDIIRWSREDSEKYWETKDKVKETKKDTARSTKDTAQGVAKETAPVAPLSDPIRAIELASPRKLQPQVRNILHEILGEEPEMTADIPDIMEEPTFPEPTQVVEKEPTENAAKPPSPASSKPPSPASSKSSSNSSNSSTSDTPGVVAAIEKFCGQVTTAIDGLTRAVDRQTDQLRRLVTHFEREKRARTRSPVSQRHGSDSYKRYRR